jgi:hypothetical protein
MINKKIKKRVIILTVLILILATILIIINEQRTVTPSSLIFSIQEEKSDLENIKELEIKLKAKVIAYEINEYLKNNPSTIKELQENKIFQNIAVQSIEETGYTIIVDADTGQIYFHPQKNLVNQNLAMFKETLPELWLIFQKILGTCNDAHGYYAWHEEDKELTNKFLYITCTQQETEDQKKLLVAATKYLDDDIGKKYVEQYELDDFSNMIKTIIEQKVKDVTKQIDIYLRAYPNKTIKELQDDAYFQNIAVQDVPETGYTTIMDSETLINYFHKHEEFVGTDYNTYKNSRPEWFEIIDKSKNCEDSYGFYDWIEPDGTKRKNSHIIHAQQKKPKKE